MRWGTAASEPGLPVFTLETREPFVDPDPYVATDGLHLRARLVRSGEGWEITLELDLPDCGTEACSCPCS